MKAQIINLEGTPSEIKEFINSFCTIKETNCQETKSADFSEDFQQHSSPDTLIKKKEQEEKREDTASTMTTSIPIKDLIDKDYKKNLKIITFKDTKFGSQSGRYEYGN